MNKDERGDLKLKWEMIERKIVENNMGLLVTMTIDSLREYLDKGMGDDDVFPIYILSLHFKVSVFTYYLPVPFKCSEN